MYKTFLVKGGRQFEIEGLYYRETLDGVYVDSDFMTTHDQIAHAIAVMVTKQGFTVSPIDTVKPEVQEKEDQELEDQAGISAWYEQFQ